MNCTLLLLNGGIGSRVGQPHPKQLIKINGIPMIVYSLISASLVDEINEIIINYPLGYKEAIENIVSDYAIKKKVIYIEGGTTRQESVYKMLQHSSNETVLIHESARPLVTKKHFENLLKSSHFNVGLMIEIPFTVVPVDTTTHLITGVLDRSRLRNVQLPQKFDVSDLLKAHEWAILNNKKYTEDTSLCTDYGHGIEVYYLDGSERNIKITTSEDIKIASFLLGGQYNE